MTLTGHAARMIIYGLFMRMIRLLLRVTSEFDENLLSQWS